jgi:hypothetical protein
MGIRQLRSKRSSPPPREEAAWIGHACGGDLEWSEDGLLLVPEAVLREHGVISGGSGSGKSTFSLRLIAECARMGTWRIYYLDAKADEETALQFVAVMEQCGIPVRVFPNEPMDGWRGEPSVLRNRLMQLLTYSESFYKDGARLLVGLALNTPGSIPRSSTAFLRRLDRTLLEALHAGTPAAGVLSRIDGVHWNGTMLRYESFFTAAQQLLDGSWSWEDTSAAYIALDSVGAPDDAQALGRFLIEDFGHFIKHRKPKGEQVLLIIDEFSALAEHLDIANLFQRIRSSGGSVFVIVHGDASMERQAEKLFQACANIIVFQSNEPAHLIAHAGTRLVPDYSQHRPSQQKGGAETTPRGLKPARSSTLRMQEKPKIDANQVRQLGKGEGFWIYQGRFQKMAVTRLSFSEAWLQTIQQRILPLQPPTRNVLPPSPLLPQGAPVGGTPLPQSTGTDTPSPSPAVAPTVHKKKGRGLFDA